MEFYRGSFNLCRAGVRNSIVTPPYHFIRGHESPEVLLQKLNSQDYIKEDFFWQCKAAAGR